MQRQAIQTGRGLRSLWLATMMALVLAACSPMMRYHGYAPSDADLAAIVVGQDTRETVAQKIGQPGMGGVMEGSGWFYVQSDWRQREWRAAEEVDRQVVAITFDARGRVANIERFGTERGEVITLSRRITDAGPTPSVFSQVFRVLGQFSAASFAGG